MTLFQTQKQVLRISSSRPELARSTTQFLRPQSRVFAPIRASRTPLRESSPGNSDIDHFSELWKHPFPKDDEGIIQVFQQLRDRLPCYRACWNSSGKKKPLSGSKCKKQRDFWVKTVWPILNCFEIHCKKDIAKFRQLHKSRKLDLPKNKQLHGKSIYYEEGNSMKTGQYWKSGCCCVDG